MSPQPQVLLHLQIVAIIFVKNLNVSKHTVNIAMNVTQECQSKVYSRINILKRQQESISFCRWSFKKLWQI